MQKGEIYWVDIGEKDGCVQSGGKDGLRLCLIVSNDTACRVSPVITVVPISSSPRRVFREQETTKAERRQASFRLDFPLFSLFGETELFQKM